MPLHIVFIKKTIDCAPKKIDPRFDPVRYNGNNHPYLGISTPEKHKIASSFKKQFPDISFDELIATLNKLNNGKTFEEKTIGPMILMKYKKHIFNIKPKHIDCWLENLAGWCEIDTLCQSTFPPNVFLNNWNTWQKTLQNWSKDANINKRRASLVLLCKVVRLNDDPRLKDLAFENTERLKNETDILITKAVSWVLREMTKNFRSEVQKYLDNNKDSLPKIAVRETRKKLKTGRKT